MMTIQKVEEYTHNNRRQHAIVIGGSMAGMLTARVLADTYERVTVLDRDAFPNEPEHRKGVPQSQHAHGLLARGQMIIEELFPGILREMRDGGAWATGDLLIVSPMGKLPMNGPPPSNDVPADQTAQAEPSGEIQGAFVSRFFLEWTVRRRLQMLENIAVRSEVEVLDLLTNDDKKSITGVTLRKRNRSEQSDDCIENGIENLLADLVVDASGRRSKVLTWLTDLGYEAPPHETINSDIGYASRFYRKPKNFPAEWAAIIINGRAPENPRVGLILPIEDDKWHVTVGGMAGNHPPTDEAGFMQWARDLPDPSLYEAIRVAEPITPIRGYRTETNSLHHFEKLTRWPKNFIVTGDAVCAFNPIYGQGMTTSALDALAIRKVLREWEADPSIDLEGRARDEIAKTVAAPWLIATGEDLRWRGVKLSDGNHLGTRLRHRYMNLYLKQATQDQQLAGLYFAVLNMLAPPTLLMHPMIAARVLWATWKNWRKQPNVGEEMALSRQALTTLRSQPAYNES